MKDKIINLNTYQKKNNQEEKYNAIQQKNYGNTIAKPKNETNKKRNPYEIIKLLRAQNWIAKRAFKPRVEIRISAFTPNGIPAVKIRL